MIDTLTAPSPTKAAGATDINHIYCCDSDTALCGANVSGQPEVDLDDADCIVCLDLEDDICPNCGE